jgi:anti-sigma factor RsiW
MNCRKVKASLADLLFEPEQVSVELRDHVAACPACRQELAELRATMNALDAWQAPEPTPYFDAKLFARLRDEQQAPPAGFFERLRARLLYSSNLHMRPVAAGALAVILIAGGSFAGFRLHQPPPQQPQESAAVKDLQSLDGNALVYQQLDTLDQSDDDQGTDPSNL